LALNGDEHSDPHHSCFNPGGYPLNRKLGGPQGQYAYLREEINLLPLLRFEPQIICSVAYTDYAMKAMITAFKIINKLSLNVSDAYC
jgi:hypothetical protein